LGRLKKRYARAKLGLLHTKEPRDHGDLKRKVRTIIDDLDNQGRWVSVYQGERLVGQPRFERNRPYISSAVFARNIELLSDYLVATR
jgi:hypothetical protein